MVQQYPGTCNPIALAWSYPHLNVRSRKKKKKHTHKHWTPLLLQSYFFYGNNTSALS